MRGCRGFSIIELLVALLVVAVGLGAILRLFDQTANTAHRHERLTQARALGRGLIAESQPDPQAAELTRQVREAASRGETLWPSEPRSFEGVPSGIPPLTWQWRWTGDLPAQGPLHLELFISSDWEDPGETVRLPVTL
ncbi:prepilin-type N-terminal cleavage/methylation domain-containing protein [Candidatus Sumerlaeota bacterium]|nr:prepilin-type N-terminal cleavage/methylation domain-containing protein [Candidatus Sumerlaeota bacterium]